MSGPAAAVKIELRPVQTDAEVDGYLDVRNQVEPADPVSRDAFEASRARPDRLDLLALLDDRPVGMGFVGRNMGNFDSAHALCKVGVLQGSRTRGIGGQLYRSLSAHARSFGRQGLETEIREDQADALAYLGKRGYQTTLRVQEIALQLATAPSPAPSAPPAGVTLAPLSNRALERLLYDAAVEIEPDLPGAELVVTPPFEDWCERLRSAGLIGSCSFAALADGAVIAMGLLFERPWGGAHGLTGTRRAWRRRGVARAIKSAQIAASREAGLRELRTSNEIANAAIRGLNESLGYQPLVAWLHLRGPLLLG